MDFIKREKLVGFLRTLVGNEKTIHRMGKCCVFSNNITKKCLVSRIGFTIQQ